MFAGKRRGLNFRLEEGQKVIVGGSVEIFERDGKYQLYANQITLDGAGELYLRFEALKKELEEMGMFAEEYKQRIPAYAKTPALRRFELRNPDATCNPYFCYAAILMAGLDGIKNKIDPHANGWGPYDVNLYNLPEEEKAKLKALGEKMRNLSPEERKELEKRATEKYGII